MLAKQDTGRAAYTLWSISQAQHRSQHVNLCSSLSRHAKNPAFRNGISLHRIIRRCDEICKIN